MVCPKCKSKDVSRKIIGTEYETCCDNCGYFNSSDHFLKSYSIFIEGYVATGQAARAKKIGTALGTTFRNAAITFSESEEAAGYGDFDKHYLAFWGCRVFDNLEDAQRRFG